MFALQTMQLALHLTTQPRQRVGAVALYFEKSQSHRILELDERKHRLVRELRRVGVPQKYGIYRARVVSHKLHKIEYVTVILGCLHADVVQRGCVAEIVLGGVGVGVEHKLRSVHLARGLGTILKEIVEVGIDAQQQLLARAGNHREQHLLALGQILAVGHRDLESEIVVLEVIENRAPEGHILVALDKDLHPSATIIHGQGQRGHRVAFATSRSLVSQFFDRCAFHNLS